MHEKMANSANQFSKGTKIEVQKPKQYYTATVLEQPSPRTKKKRQLYVEYDTLYEADGVSNSKRLKECMDFANVRPMQPKEQEASFEVGYVVDAYYEEGWRKGIVMDVYGNNESCLVLFYDGEDELEFESCDVRLHREWDADGGGWLPPFDHVKHENTEECEMEEKLGKTNFETGFNKGRRPATKFRKMQMVEVSSDEEGYEASWYAAKIVECLGNNKYLVEYFTLEAKADDNTTPLKEEVIASYIRPFPPLIRSDDFCTQFEEVDAWYNGGWWRGMISNVLEGNKYVVCFANTRKELMFDHCNLRPHLDWVNRQWVNSSKIAFKDLSWKTKDVKAERTNTLKMEVKFSKGIKVEVKSDEEGYRGSWYAATIEELKDNGIYLVRYETLMADDEADFLIEEADASRIRPSPPEIVHPCPFVLLDCVDAWYNEGWWEGSICKVLHGLKYAVYFTTSNEILEFDHRNLRPHQEWKDGKWAIAE